MEAQMNDRHEDVIVAKPDEEDLLAVAAEIFDFARMGDSAALAAVIERGVPPNLRNEKGDSLLMLASYHGHSTAVQTLVAAGADPDLRNNSGQTPVAGAAYKGTSASSRPCLPMEPMLRVPRPTARPP
jgi:uncharacterized protein